MKRDAGPPEFTFGLTPLGRFLSFFWCGYWWIFGGVLLLVGLVPDADKSGRESLAFTGLGLGLLLITAPVWGQTLYFLTGKRWRGTLALGPTGLVIDSGALLREKWYIARVDIAEVQWTSPSGQQWVVRLAPVTERAPRRKKGDWGWRTVSPSGRSERALLITFVRPQLPPARWKRITSATLAKMQQAADHRGEPVTTLAFPLRADPLLVKHTLEEWGVPFPASWSPTGSGPA